MITDHLDYYKLTMSQFMWAGDLRDVEVTFTLANRDKNLRLMDYINWVDLTDRLREIRVQGWTSRELDYLSSLGIFTQEYIKYLRDSQLPEVAVGYTVRNDDLFVTATGPAPLVTFWETIVMSQVSELYYTKFIGLTLDDERINEAFSDAIRPKINYLQANPDVKIAEFGTRRRASFAIQDTVISLLKNECPENLLGTSNVGAAMFHKLAPIGTYAHELPMIYAGVAEARGADIRKSHSDMLMDWALTYGDQLGIGLHDTFGSNAFFEDFGYVADGWRGVRHDSGDPFAFGERLIQYYEYKGIDPRTKLLLFSDGLKLNPEDNTVDKLYWHFGGRIGLAFGIGTNLSFDLNGLVKPLNIVMKATHVRLPCSPERVTTVKLSDVPGKHMGDPNKVQLYKKVFNYGI